MLLVLCMWGGGGGGGGGGAEMMRKMLNEVLWYVYVIGKVQCALGCVHILLALLFLYCALQAHVRCKRLTNTLLHYLQGYFIISLEKLNMWLNINHITVHNNTYILKGLAHTDLAKK